MSFVLTEEQRAFRDVMRSFVDEQVAPYAAEHDRDQTYPRESFDACVKMDLPAMQVPAAYGGVGADMVTQAIMIEQLARGCASTSVTILISKLAMLPIMNFASEEIKQSYLPPVSYTHLDVYKRQHLPRREPPALRRHRDRQPLR